MDNNSFLVRLGLDTEEISAGVKKSNLLIESFVNQVTELGGTIAKVFAVEKVVEFTLSVSELAAKAHGVKEAFNQIPEATSLLEQLRQVTHDTVSDLSLMGFAIHAQNLNIPLQDLGELLEFAHVRALQTNQDFNTLANTLITSIGRGGQGAKRAMAELQISTEDYEAALKKTGNSAEAVMLLAKEAIDKNKGSIDKTNQALEQNSAKWDNFKEKLGEVINNSGILAYVLNQVNNALDGLTNTPNALEKINSQINYIFEQYQNNNWEIADNALKQLDKNAQNLGVTLHKIYNANGDLISVTAEQIKKSDENVEVKKKEISVIENIKTIEEEIKELRGQQETALGNELTKINQQIQALQKKEELLKNQGKILPIEQQVATPGRFNLDSSITAEATLAASNVEKAYANMAKNVERDLGIIKPAFVSLADQNKESLDRMKDEAQQMIDVHNAMALSIGSAIGTAIGHYKNFAQGLAQATVGIVDSLEKQALAAIIADAAKTGGSPVVAIALAAAGFAAIKALFAQIGGSSGGGGSFGGGQGSSLNRSGINLTPQQIHVTGQMSGRDVVLVYDKNKTLDAQRKGG